MNWNKFINVFFGTLFVGVVIWAGLFFLDLYRDFTHLRAEEEHNRRILAEAQSKLVEQQRYLERLRSDPTLLEQVIRKKLDYVRNGELIFRFPEEKHSP